MRSWKRVLTDNGSGSGSARFGATLSELGARQTFIRAGRPATNGAVERAQRTILEECWRPSFACSLVPKLHGLTRDLAAYLRYYNEERAHWSADRRADAHPGLDRRAQDEARMTEMCRYISEAVQTRPAGTPATKPPTTMQMIPAISARVVTFTIPTASQARYRRGPATA